MKMGNIVFAIFVFWFTLHFIPGKIVCKDGNPGKDTNPVRKSSFTHFDCTGWLQNMCTISVLYFY